MDPSIFDDIRPYNDSEIPDALRRIAQHDLIPQVLRFIYPHEDPRDSMDRLLSIRGAHELQSTFMLDAIRRIVQTTSTGFTFSGLDNIKRGRPYLFISNHRDITLDAFLLQKLFLDRGGEASYIVFGNNLIDTPLMRDLFLCNNMIQMERGGGNPIAFYRSLQHLSQYLHYIIAEKQQSVWIAQKNGRSKDGVDSTAPAIIKMLLLGSDKPATEAVADLHIVPVAISYEWDPCDLMKSNELYLKAHGGYEKVEGEDYNSVVTGIIGQKGKIHLAIGKPLTSAELRCADDHEVADHVASVLDQRIQHLYHLMPTNYLAHDLLTGSNRYRQYYSADVKNAFTQRMASLDEGRRQIMLKMYANPVISAKR